MADSNDWLGGYTLTELLGSAPVSKTKKQLKNEKKRAKKESGKRGLVSATVGAPFRLVATLIKLPVIAVTKIGNGIIGAIGEIVKLPFRLVSALASPWKRQD